MGKRMNAQTIALISACMVGYSSKLPDFTSMKGSYFDRLANRRQSMKLKKKKGRG